jgi:hypothetical protein
MHGVKVANGCAARIGRQRALSQWVDRRELCRGSLNTPRRVLTPARHQHYFGATQCNALQRRSIMNVTQAWWGSCRDCKCRVPGHQDASRRLGGSNPFGRTTESRYQDHPGAGFLHVWLHLFHVLCDRT